MKSKKVRKPNTYLKNTCFKTNVGFVFVAHQLTQKHLELNEYEFNANVIVYCIVFLTFTFIGNKYVC